jgi:DNA polymerase (family 10)
LNEYGFSPIENNKKSKKSLKTTPVKDESDIYKRLELPFIQPELREDIGEIEAAELHKLPILIEISDLKGTFHCHTTYSDGAANLEEMALAAKEKGWQYIGIADHSKSAAYANGLTADRVKKQVKEIDRLNQNWANFRIIKGIEVDILSDGTLDFPDTVLSQFDYVVASIHSGFKMPEKEMTQRIIKAMKNKYVTMLGHITGRLLLQREPYLLDQNAVIQAVGEMGKVIEINSHPSRLDIDWRICPLAKKCGVIFAINPDAHTIEGLSDVRYGINVARKGWLQKSDVINTKSLIEIQRYFNRA